MNANAYSRKLYTLAVKVGANVATLVAVFVAMYQSSLHPAESLYVFCLWFFGIGICTWMLARTLLRRIRVRYADSDEGLVRLPGQRRESLVRWKVCGQTPVLERCTSQR